MTEKKKSIKQKQKQSQKQVVNVNINQETKKPRKKKSKKTSQQQQINTYTSPQQKMRMFNTFQPPMPNPFLPSNYEVIDTIKNMMGRQNMTPVINDIAPRLNDTLQNGINQITNEIRQSRQVSEEIKKPLPQPVEIPKPDVNTVLPPPEKPSLTKEDAGKKIVDAVDRRMKQIKGQKEFYDKARRWIYDDAASTLQSAVRRQNAVKEYDKMVEDDFANSDMLKAIRRAQKKGSANVSFVYTPQKGKKPSIVESPAPKPISENVSAQLVFADPMEVENTVSAPAKRKRGRPLGSGNKTPEQKEADKRNKEFEKLTNKIVKDNLKQNSPYGKKLRSYKI
jgi:hypothetical protein